MSIVIEAALSSPLKNIVEKIINNQRINFDDALTLYNSSDVLTIGALADYARSNRENIDKKDFVYFVDNHHINLTNMCEGSCSFCAYKKEADDPESYFMTIKDVEKYIVNKIDKNIKELHIVSAINKEATLNYYIELFSLCKKLLPEVHIQALTAVEVDHLAKLEQANINEILKELINAGLGSLPGGGAEIFDERIRKLVCPEKISADRWLEVMKAAHNTGIKSNATMLSGIGETYSHRVDHIDRIRKLQDETKGFMTFIPLFCHYENTNIKEAENNTGIDNLKDLAISRIYLDNIEHIKAFWIQLGIKLAQISLAFGVDDLDGTVVKEKISSSAGANSNFNITKEYLINIIKNASKIPVERDTVYNIIKIY